MPGIFYQPINRRKFLQRTSGAFATVAFSGGTNLFAQKGATEEKSVRLALLSDIHIPADPENECRKFFPWQNLKTVVPQVSEARPQAVLVDGDLARLTGEVADYEQVKKLLLPLAERMPIYLGLGNHDQRENFLKV